MLASGPAFAAEGLDGLGQPARPGERVTEVEEEPGIVGIGLEPSAHGEPLGGLVSVPAVLVGQNHFNDVVAQVAEQREKFWKHEKIRD